MSATVTFRLDLETARILRALTRRDKVSKSRAIKEALRAQWNATGSAPGPSAWEIYTQLKISAAREPQRDRARHSESLLKEILIAKRRAGTL